ncbi:MAG: MATE family efflux transporter, partial [Oscillospiraceae bacterium]|nr:MATE family efflux transporter [Oscillospiraceae bacterium]
SMNSFYQSSISFVSQNYGAGKYDRIDKSAITALCCVTVTGVVLGNLAVIFARHLLSIYSSDPAVIDAGVVRMSVIMRTYALCGMMDVMVGALRGVGRSALPMIVSFIGVCGFRLLWIFTVFRIPQFHRVQTIYLSYPISWAIAFGANTICFIIIKHIEAKKRAANRA